MAQTRTDRDPSSPPLDRATEKRVVEALVLVSDEPITLDQIGQVLTGRTPEELRRLLEDLESDLQTAGSGLRVESVAGGYRFSTRPELAPWIRTYFRNRNRARLSAAAIETLAVVAYKQPITAPEIQEIRGVDPQGAVKTLLEKRLVRIAGKKKVVGRPFLYCTTRQFLMHFGLASIEDLPPLEDFERLAGELASGAISDPDPKAQLPSDQAAGGGLIDASLRIAAPGEEGPEGEGSAEDGRSVWHNREDGGDASSPRGDEDE